MSVTEITRAGARGPVLIARIAVLLPLVLLFPDAIRAAHAQEPTAGLFFRAGRADAVFAAPTLASEVDISVAGLVSRVTVRQHFINPARVWMEGIYVFPLPERAAVDRLTMTVGGREIAGRIMERAEARKAFEEAAAQASAPACCRPSAPTFSLPRSPTSAPARRSWSRSNTRTGSPTRTAASACASPWW